MIADNIEIYCDRNLAFTKHRQATFKTMASQPFESTRQELGKKCEKILFLVSYHG